MTRPAPRRRLARRLLMAQALVIVAGGVTLAVVGLLVMPPLTRTHVRRALGPVSDTVIAHLDQALTSALGIALAIAVGAAIVAALVVSWVLSSRLARPVERLAQAANRIAAGELSARGPQPVVDDELADLTHAFNDMAAALGHSERTRSRLLADLAHELRTPLSTVEGYLEGLEDGVVAADEQTWSTLRAATARLRRLVDDVGLVSRAEEGQLAIDPEPMAVSTLVQSAAAATAGAFHEAQVTLDSDLAPDLPMVNADHQRMAQVLDNLLRNACRHSAPGGVVTIRARGHDDDVAIQVIDTGEGIPADQLPHVFERFYRGDAARTSDRGSGIGLTIVQAIAHAHDGHVSAHSDGPGCGATFTLRLPTINGQDGPVATVRS